MKLIERAAYLTLESLQIPREINLPVENKVKDGFYVKYFITIWHVRLIHHGLLRSDILTLQRYRRKLVRLNYVMNCISSSYISFDHVN